MADPYLSSVVLLLHAESGNASNPVDSSGVAGRTLSLQGASVTTSVAAAGTGSILLSGASGGNNSHVDTDSSTDFVTNAALTFECYVRGNAWSSTNGKNELLRVGNLILSYDTSVNKLTLSDGTTTSVGSVQVLSTSAFNHLALQRDGSGNWKVWYNGTLDISPGTIFAASELGTATTARVGSADTTYLCPQSIYFDEVRFTKGVARYSGATITPPTIPFDTPAGGGSSGGGGTTTFASDQYFQSVLLLMHGRGPTGCTSLVDSSVYQRAITANGSTQISTAQHAFETSSVLLNGTTDYISTAQSQDFNPGAAGTILVLEAMVNFSSTTGAPYLFHLFNAAGDRVLVQWDTGNSRWMLWTAKASVAASWNGPTSTLATGQWHHYALVINGSNAVFYIDGAVSISASGITTFSNLAMQCNVGAAVGAANSNYLSGYVQELRVTRGVMRYSGAFSAPAAPFPDGIGKVVGTIKDSANAATARRVRAIRRIDGAIIADKYSGSGDTNYYNTVLLVHGIGINGSTTFNDSSIFSRAATRVGSPTISTAQSKYMPSSVALTSGNYLTFANSNEFAFGNLDFTIEAWVYLTSYSASYSGVYKGTIVAKDTSAAGGRSFAFNINGTATSWTGIEFTGFTSDGVYVSVSGSASLALNTWHHVAVARVSGVCYLFLNGALLNAGGTAMSNSFQVTTTTLRVGATDWDATYKYYLPGYMNDLRITKGVGRYNAAFTPPGDRLPDKYYNALGEYDFFTQTLDELDVIALDDDAGTVYNDLISRVVPA